MKNRQNASLLLSQIFGFLANVWRDFRRNQGFLLAGAIAYYTLLSVVPMSILALIVLSHFIARDLLFQTLSTYIEMMIPGYAATLTEQVRVFLEHGKSVGIFVFLMWYDISRTWEDYISPKKKKWNLYLIGTWKLKRRHIPCMNICLYRQNTKRNMNL